MDPLKAEKLARHPAAALQELRAVVPHVLAAAPRVAILIPCYNEAQTVAGVVTAFQAVLPSATVYVYDSNSTDDTSVRARAAGALVRTESLPGKGHVIRRMFADIDADLYVLVDGDGTHDAASAPKMIDRLLDDDLDMVNAARDRAGDAYHRLLTGIVSYIFGSRLTDMQCGYRVLSRRFAKSFPGLTQGFAIETELTVHALELRLPIAEVHAPYVSRPPGAASKRGTTLWPILVLIKDEWPLPLFSLIAAIFAAASLLPAAVPATGLMILAFLSLASGLILDAVTRGRRELKRLHYLSISK